MSILITGGAGFIGSHTAKLLSDSGLNVVILDNLSTGLKRNVRCGCFVEGDIADGDLVRSLLRQYRVSTVLHLAALANVADSMSRPRDYFNNNVCGSLRLLDSMTAEGVKELVLASSSSVYGRSDSSLACEEEPPHPISPYGESKLQIERVLPWYERTYGLRSAVLRYFNVAGATAELGEDPSHSVRIIPRAFQAAFGTQPPLQIHGTAFATADGSAVRDYVHVSDVARANLKALQFVRSTRSGAIINVGSSVGVSVLRIVEEVGALLGMPVPYQKCAARPGDPAYTVANISKAKMLLQWTPEESDIAGIVSSFRSFSRDGVAPVEDLARERHSL